MSSPQNNFVAVSRRPPDIEDYIDMMRRYRSWIIGPMFLGLVIATVIAFYWDDTYVSHATMRISPQQVSPILIQNTASTQLGQRLDQITTTILSHSNLTAIIIDPQLNLYPKERAKGKALEDVATDMVKDIKVQTIGVPMELGDRRIASAFQISFSYTDRVKAQKVVSKLVSMYEDQNTREQRDQAHHTSEFVSEQLKAAQEKLAQTEGAITKFTMENRGTLPQEYQSNITAQQSLRFQASSASDAVTYAQSQRATLEAELRDLQRRQTGAQNSLMRTVQSAAAAASEQAVKLQSGINSLELALASARQNYRDDMPEVMNLKSQLDFLKKKLEETQKEDAERAAANPAAVMQVKDPQAQEVLDSITSRMSQVRAQISQQDATITKKTEQIEELQREMLKAQRSIDASGVNSQEYNRLLHDRDMAQQLVQDQQKKQVASATQESMEDRMVGEKLETLDMASLPEVATEPKREIWATVGTVIGLLIGLVLAGAKEMKNTSLKNLKDVRAYTNLPVLSSIPLLENALLVRRKRRLFWLAWTSAFIVGLVCISASMYYHFVLRAT